MKYEKLIRNILKNIGGKENINSVSHCITRLRFKLKDESICNTDVIKKMEGVVTVMQSGGQYQVVIGNHVPEVYNELMQISGLTEGEPSGTKISGNIFDMFIDILSGVFQPILGVLCATGMIKGLLALATNFNLLENTSGTYIILFTIADCLLNFMPIFLGFTAAKKFGLNQFTGMAIGSALVYPTIAAALTAGEEPLMVLFQGTFLESPVFMKFLGIPVIIPNGAYISTVIPVIVSVALAAPLERWLKRTLPSVVKSFLTPFITLLIIVPLTFLMIGPIASWLSSALGYGVTNLYEFSPAVTGLIIGILWQVLVIFGLHWGLIPLAILNIGNVGYDPLLALAFTCSFAQTGVVGAIMLKTKDTMLKSLTIPAFISGIFGVTEPAIYGITLPRKKYFIISCIGGAVGGAVIGFFKIKTFMMGGLGVFAYPTFINPNGPENYITPAILISLLGFAVGFVLTLILYKDEKVVSAEQSDLKDSYVVRVPASDQSETDRIIASPLSGEVIALEDLEDAAFASGAIGKGVAVEPDDGRVYAPADGEITVLFETKHAICITTDDGVEIMIHIGMDTVQLNGRCFTPFVKQGDRVKKGQLLEEVDLQGIKEAGFSIVTPIVVTNTEIGDVVATTKKSVTNGDELLYVMKEK